jgi:hypothetical protein
MIPMKMPRTGFYKRGTAMMTMKRFARTALLVLGATLCASTPAWAQIDLTPTGAEPGATGQASSSHVRFVNSGIIDPAYGIGSEYYTCTLYVTCQGLTPGATYTVTNSNAGTFKASRDGTGSVKVVKYPLIWEYQNGMLYLEPRVQVYRINPDGSYTLVLWEELSSPWF